MNEFQFLTPDGRYGNVRRENFSQAYAMGAIPVEATPEVQVASPDGMVELVPHKRASELIKTSGYTLASKPVPLRFSTPDGRTGTVKLGMESAALEMGGEPILSELALDKPLTTDLPRAKVDDAASPFRNWFGPLPKQPESLTGWEDYTSLLERNAKGKAGFWEGVTPTQSNIPFYGVGKDAVDIGKLVMTANRIRDGKPVADQDVLDMNIYLANMERQSTATKLGKTGKVFVDMLTFMAEIGSSVALMSALGAGAGTGAAALSGKASVKGGQSALQKFAMSYSKELAERALTKKYGSAAANWMRKGALKAASKAVAAAPQSIAMTVGTTVGQVGSAVLQTTAAGQEAGTRKGNQDRLFAALKGEDMDATVALWRGIGDTAIENWSESLGGLLTGGFSKVTGLGAIGKKFGNSIDEWARAAGVAAGDVNRIKATSVVGTWFAKQMARGVPVRSLTAHLQNAGYHGVVGEMLEERAGDFVRGLTGLEGEKDDNALARAVGQMIPSWEQAQVELMAFSLPMAIIGGAHGLANVGRWDEIWRAQEGIAEATHLANNQKIWEGGKLGSANIDALQPAYKTMMKMARIYDQEQDGFAGLMEKLTKRVLNMKYDRAEGRMVSNPDILFASTMSMPVAEVGNRARALTIEEWKKQHPTEKTVPDDVLDEADAVGAEFAAHAAAADGRYVLVYRDSEQGARERDAYLDAWKSKPENKGKAVPKEVQEEADAIFAKNYKPGTGGTTTMDRARKLGWSEKDLSAFAAVGLVGIDKERGLIFMRDPESLGSRENDLAADALLLASNDPKAKEIVSKKALNLPMLGSTYEEQVKSVASAIGRLKEATPERLAQARVGQNITPGRILNLADKRAWEAEMRKMERDDPNFHRMGLGEWMDWKGRRTKNLWLNPDLSSADPGTPENMLYRYASNKMTDLAERSRARFLLGGAMQATLDSDIAPLVNILAASRDGTFFLPSDVFTEPSVDPNAPEERYRVQSVRYDQATQKDLYSVVKLDLFGAPTATVLKDMTVEQLKDRFALPAAPEIRLTEFDFVDGTFEEMRQHLLDAGYINVDHLCKEGETPNEALKRYTEEDMRKALFPHVAPYTTADGKRLWRYKNGAMSHDFGILMNLLSIAESEGAGLAEDFLEVPLRRLSIGADGQKSVANLFSAMPLSAAGFKAAVASASAALQAKIKADGATKEQRSKAAADLAALQALPSLESDDVVKVIEFFSKFLIRFENGYINSPAAAKMPLARGFAVLSENATNFKAVVRDAHIELGRVAPQSYIRALDYKKREAPAEEAPPAAGPLATPPEPKEPPKPGDGAAPAKAEDPVLSPAPAPAKKAEAPPAEAPAVVEAVPAPVAEQPAAADAPAAAGVEAAPQAAEQQAVAAPFAPADATPQNSLAVLRPDGSIVVDEAAARADFGAGFPYLRGESPLTGSAQKKEVFARVDLEKFKAALGSAERYIEFIRLHEEGHRAQRESGELKTYPKDWMSPEAILIERKANKYAMDALGIKISDVRKEVAADAPPQEVDFANIPPEPELDLGVVETPEPSAEELEAVRLLDVEQQANVFVPPEVSDEFVIPVGARIPVPEVEIPLEAMQAPEEELSQEQLDAKRMLDEGNYADQDKGERVKKNAPRASVSKEGRRRAAARFKEGMSIAAETKDRAVAIFRALPAEDRAALLRRVYFIADYSDLVPEATHRDLQRELARIPGFTQDEIDSLYVAVLDEDPSIAPFLLLTTREQEAVDAEEASRAAKELALNGEPSDELAALFGESEAADALEYARSGSDNAMAGKANDAKVAKLLHSELRSLGMLSRRYGGASLIPLAIEGFRSKYGSRGTPAFLRNDEAFEAWAAEQKADEFSTKRLSAAGLRNLVEIELASMSRMKAIEVFSALTGTVPVEAVLFELSDRAESRVRPYSASESSPGALLRTRRNDLFANPTEFISEFLVRMEPYAVRDAAGNVTGWNDPAIYPDDVLKSEVSEPLARLFAFLMLPRAAREDLELSSADVQKALWRWATQTKAEQARKDRLESLGQSAPAVFRSTVKMWLKTAVEAARITRTNPDGVVRKLDDLMYQLTNVTDPTRQALVQHMRLSKLRRLTVRVGSQTVNPILRGTLSDFYDKMEAAGTKDKIMLFGGFKDKNDRLVKVSESLWNEFMLGWKEYVRNQHSVFGRGKRTANEAHIPVHIETGDKTDRIYMYRATFKEMFGDAKIEEDFDKFYAALMSKDGPWSRMYRWVAEQTYGTPKEGAEAKWFKRTSQLVTPRDRLQEVDGGLVFERNPETNEPELLVAVPKNVGDNYGGDGAMYVLRSKEAQFRRSAGLPDGEGPIVAKGQFIAGPALLGAGKTILIKTASAATSGMRAKFMHLEGDQDSSVLSAAAMAEAEDALSGSGVTFVASPSARKLDLIKPEKTVTSGGIEYDIYRVPAHAFGFAATMDTGLEGSRNPNIANQSILVEASAMAVSDPVAAEMASAQLADMYSGNRERLLRLLSAEGEWTPGFEKSLADSLEEDQPALADLLREQGLARSMEIPEVFHAVARKAAARVLERGIIPVASQGVYAALTSVESSAGTPSNSVSRYELKAHGILGEGWETNAGEDSSWLTPTAFAEDGSIRPAMVGIPITDAMRSSNSFYGPAGETLRRSIANELAPQMPWTTVEKIYEVLPAFDAYRGNSREFRFDEPGTPFRSAEDVARLASFLATRYGLGSDLLQSDESDNALLEAGFALPDFTGINIRGGAILPRTENGALVGVVISGTPGLTDYRVPYSGPASGAPFVLAFDTGGPVAIAHPDVVKGKGADFDFDAGHIRLIDPRSADFRLVRRAWRMREALNAAGWNVKDFGVNPDALMSALAPLLETLSTKEAPAYATQKAIAQNIESVRASGAIGLLASFNFAAQLASPIAVPPKPEFKIAKDRWISDTRMWPGEEAHNGHPLPIIRAPGKMNHELYRMAIADALLNVIVDYIKLQDKAAPLGMIPETVAMMAWGVCFLEVPETVPAPVEIVVNKKTDERRMQTEHEARYAHVARHTVGAMANYFRSSPVAQEWVRLAKETASLLNPVKPRDIAKLVAEKFAEGGKLTPEVGLEINALSGVEASTRGMYELSAVLRANQKTVVNSVADMLETEGKAARLLRGILTTDEAAMYGIEDSQLRSPLGAPIAGSGAAALQVAVENALSTIQRLRGAGFPDPLEGIAPALVATAEPLVRLSEKALAADLWKKALVGLVAKRHDVQDGITTPHAAAISISKRSQLEHAIEGMFLVDALTAMRGKSVPFAELYSSVKERLDNLAVNDPALSTNPLVANLFLSTYSRAKGEGRQIEYKMEVVDAPQDMSERTEAWDDLPMDLQIDLAELNVRMHGAMGGVQGSLSDWFSPAFLYARQPHIGDARRWYAANLSPALLSTPEWKENLMFVLGPTLGGKASNFGGRGLQNFKVSRVAPAPAPAPSEFAGVSDAELADMHTKKRSLAIESEINRRKKAGQGISQWKMLAKAKAKAAPAAAVEVVAEQAPPKEGMSIAAEIVAYRTELLDKRDMPIEHADKARRDFLYGKTRERNAEEADTFRKALVRQLTDQESEVFEKGLAAFDDLLAWASGPKIMRRFGLAETVQRLTLLREDIVRGGPVAPEQAGLSIDSNERFPGLPNPGQNKNTFSTRLKDGKPDPDFDLKNPESKINREAVVVPAAEAAARAPSEEAVSSLQDTLSLGNVLLYREPHPAFPDAGAVIHADEGILYLRDKASLPQMLASYAVTIVGADAPMLSTPVAPVTAQALNETVRLNYADSQLSSLLRDEITARLTGAPSLFVVPASGDMRSLWLAELAADMADLLQSNPMELLSQMRLNRKGNALVLAPLPKPRELSPGPRQLSPNDSLPWDKALSASVVPESLRTDLAEAPGPLGALLDVRAAADKGEIDDRLERVLIRSAYESLSVVTLPGVTGEADARQLEMGLSMASGYIGEYNSRRMTLKAMGIPAMHLALFDAMNELDRARTNGGLWLETEASIMEFGSPFLHLLKTNKKGYRYRDRLSRTALTLRQRQILMRYRAAVTAMAEHVNQFDLSDPAALARLKDEAKVVHGRYHKLYAETDAQAAQSAVLPEMETVAEIERDFLKEVAPLMLDPKKGGRTKEEIDLVSIVGRVKAQYDADVDAINQATADFTGGTNFLGYRANYAPHFYGWSPATDPAGEAADRDIAKQLKHADIEQTLLRKPGGAMDESAQEKHKKRIDPWTEVQQDLIAKLNHKLYARLSSAEEAPNIVQANSMILRELRRILFDSAAKHYAEGGDNPGEWVPKGMEINYLATARHIDKLMRNTRFVEMAPAEFARTYATYEEAYVGSEGTLRPRTMDYISLRKEYLERTYAAAAHKAALNAFLGFTDISGRPLVMAKPAEKIDLDRGVIKRRTWETHAENMARYYKYDYRPQGDLVAQLREMYEKHAGDERTHIIETPKVSSIEQWSAIGRNPARLIKRMVGLSPTNTSALARAYMGAVAWTKSLSFGWSAFFHTALAESVIYQSGPWKRNLFKAYLAKLFTFGKNKEFDKFWERVEAFREHRRYYNPAVAADLDVLMSAGMTTGRTAALENYVGRFQQDMARIAAKLEERYGKDVSDRLMLTVFGDKNATGWKKWWPGLTGAKMSDWMFEWFSAVKEAQMDLYLKDMAAEQGLDNGHGVPWKQARFMAQTFNDGLGGQNWNKYIWATPNVMFWLNAIMLAPNWCCPQDTRAMTKTGFKFYHELEIGDEILVFDPETKTTRWSPLKDKFVRNDYDGDMVYVKNYSRAVAMTPEHTCYVTTRNLPARIMKAKDLYPACQIPRAAPHSELPTESTVADRLVVLAGWLVTDGYVKRTVLDMKRAGGTKEFRYGKIVQSKPAMVAALKALGLQFHTEPLADSNFKANFQKHVFSIPPAEYRELESLGLMDGELSWEFISRLTKPQLELLHATMLLGDGTGQNRFCGKEREVFHMALIQTLLGKPTVSWEQKQEGGHCWLTRTVSASYIGCENGALSTKHYSGGIWCPSVETGFWVAERDGLMFITGNTLSSWNASGLGPLTQAILRNYSAPGQQRKIWTEYMPAMALWNMLLIPYALQTAIYGVGQLFGGDDDDTPLPILNEPGRKQHVDITPVMRLMPWYKGDPTGKRRMYIQFAKQVHETGVSNPFGERGWINEPIDQFMRKLSQPVKIIYEQITGLSPGSDWTLEFNGKGFLGWFNSGEPGIKGAMTSRLGYIAQKFVPMSGSQFVQNPEVFPWNHLAPTSKGSSQKAIIESMTTILATYASAKDWHRIRQVPRARAVLGGLLPQYMQAATANGYNAGKLLNTAKGIVLGGLYDDMWRALEKNDEALMRKSAASIWRVGGTLKGLNSSLSNKETAYGKIVSPEMRQQAEDAMLWAQYGAE